MNSSSHLCLVTLSLGVIFWPFWTPVLLRLLLDLDTYGGVDPMGAFSLFNITSI